MKKLGEKHMKRIASLLLTLSLVLCVLLTLTFSVNAASADSQDGLTITITTDKAEYSSDEDIQVSVNIKNNNSYKVENVSVETLLPEGLVLKNGNLVVTGIDVDANTITGYNATFTSTGTRRFIRILPRSAFTARSVTSSSRLL